MSFQVEIQCDVRSLKVLEAACNRLASGGIKARLNVHEGNAAKWGAGHIVVEGQAGTIRVMRKDNGFALSYDGDYSGLAQSFGGDGFPKLLAAHSVESIIAAATAQKKGFKVGVTAAGLPVVEVFERDGRAKSVWTIDKLGRIASEGVGFVGETCRQAVAGMEKMIGRVTRRQVKPEARAQHYQRQG